MRGHVSPFIQLCSDYAFDYLFVDQCWVGDYTDNVFVEIMIVYFYVRVLLTLLHFLFQRFLQWQTQSSHSKCTSWLTKFAQLRRALCLGRGKAHKS